MTNEEIKTEDIIEHGQRLFQSAENLRRSAPDLDALMLSLWEALEDEKFFGDVVDLGNENAGGEDEWIASAYAYNAGILSRPARAPGQMGRPKDPKPIGTVSLVTRLCNSGDIDCELSDWPWLHQACLIVGWHPQHNHDDHWEIENFEPEDENLACIFHIEHGLWTWRESDSDYAYFFVLPIFSLADENALKRFALRPVKALFNADDPKSVAKDALGEAPVLLPSSG